MIGGDLGRTPRITVCIPTRNRGTTITPTLESLRRLDHDSFEVIVVDQSTNDDCRRTFDQALGGDARFAYVRSSTVGRAVSCNIGLLHARGIIVAFTDDDCVVPSNWLSGIEQALDLHPQAAMVCGRITAAPGAGDLGYTPAFTPTHVRLHRSPWLSYRVAAAGGGNMAFRTAALREAGGFDELLGVGAPLRGGEDKDLLYRFLRASHPVLELPEPAIVHHEVLKSGAETRRLLCAYAFGDGVVYAKHLRLADPAVIPSMVVMVLRQPRWANLVLLRRPTGLLTLAAFVRGITASFRYAVNPTRRKYAPRRWPRSVASKGMAPHPYRAEPPDPHAASGADTPVAAPVARRRRVSVCVPTSAPAPDYQPPCSKDRC